MARRKRRRAGQRTWPGIWNPQLETECGVIKLMDDVYELEERLMRCLRLRTV
ncbi:MAG TPA: hypothetical protein VHK65_01590 [Candidatus Dormibacteraeota bacterium]|nr:hypothetical protein [Candidatus Dormibacteraeota bacterium]